VNVHACIHEGSDRHHVSRMCVCVCVCVCMCVCVCVFTELEAVNGMPFTVCVFECFVCVCV